ncbi:unnamed protein product [Acidithrix sp. C25]|nr:unnamed protein product [Acidithrix sp. C25]
MVASTLIATFGIGLENTSSYHHSQNTAASVKGKNSLLGNTADGVTPVVSPGQLNPAISNLNKPIVGMAATPDGKGYWLVASDGGIFTYGDAAFYGSAGAIPLNKPIVGMASTPDGKGYWLVASDGGIFTYGDAAFYGSAGAIPLNKPIVGMASTPDGKGYWLVASDGGIFTYGDAAFYGSAGAIPLNKPIVGMASTPDGKGYWLVASDGGIFTYGDAAFYGSAGAIPLNKPIVGMASTPDGKGYWLVASDGGIFTYGDAAFWGSEGGQGISDVVSIAPSGSNGYLLSGQDGEGYTFNKNTPLPTPLPVAPSNSQSAINPSGQSLVSSTGLTWNSQGVSSDSGVHFSSASPPIGQSAPAAGTFGFLETQPGSSLPVRYNPCVPIHYVVNTSEAPSWGLSLIKSAFAELHDATGITFVFDGTTATFPSSTYPGWQNGTPSPILVAWEHNGQTNYLPAGHNYVGMGGSSFTYSSSAGQYEYITGQAAISSSYNLSQGQTINLALHELGHVIGLGHTSQNSQIMYPYNQSNPTTYQSGDLAGLARLGLAAGCLD